MKIDMEAITNWSMTDLRLYWFAVKESIPCAIIFGISMLIALPRRAIIIRITIKPE